ARVDLVAVYEGPPIPDGSKSLSFRMTFAAPDRTLSDDEVREVMTRLVEAAGEIGAVIREG
ncbi:MAG: hypothetical protein GXP54_09220, partial [Deltaproteobacteria bacterium]|nr:hypothetical protein [Deltaproteobacteria bacterium]